MYTPEIPLRACSIFTKHIFFAGSWAALISCKEIPAQFTIWASIPAPVLSLTRVSSEYQRFPGMLPEAFSSAWVSAKLIGSSELPGAIILKTAGGELAGSLRVPKGSICTRVRIWPPKAVIWTRTYLSQPCTRLRSPQWDHNTCMISVVEIEAFILKLLFLCKIIVYILVIPQISKWGSMPLSCFNLMLTAVRWGQASSPGSWQRLYVCSERCTQTLHYLTYRYLATALSQETIGFLTPADCSEVAYGQWGKKADLPKGETTTFSYFNIRN